MKKLYIFFGLTIGLTSFGQNHSARSLLGPDVGSFCISNSATFITNLNSGLVTGGTNLPTVIITNSAGSYAGSGNTNSFVNALGQANLFVDRNAVYQVGPSTNSCILLGIGGAGAAATNAVCLEFVAMPDGTTEDTTSIVITNTTTVNTAVSGNWRFPLSSASFPGVKTIMLRKVYLPIAPTAANSQFSITQIDLCGFQP